MAHYDQVLRFDLFLFALGGRDFVAGQGRQELEAFAKLAVEIRSGN